MKKLTLVLLFCAGFANAETVSLLPIHSFSEDSSHSGKINVLVDYSIKCSQEFVGVLTKQVPPIILVRPSVEVRVIARELGISCESEASHQQATFDVTAIVGKYNFIAIQPD